MTQHLLARPPARPQRETAALAWGYNNHGGLGTGMTARALRPLRVSLPADTVDVQGGTDFTIALTSAGQVYAWGGNEWGQLGDGTGTHRLRPQQVRLPGHPHVVAVAAGQDHALALGRDGRVYAWGRNHYGQLGDASRIDRHAPVVVPLQARRLNSIATGNTSSYAIDERGTVHAWGNAIPLGSAVVASKALTAAAAAAMPGSVAANSVSEAQPLALPHGVHATAVDAGKRHLVVLTSDHQLLRYGLTAAGRPATQHVPLDRSWGRVTAISAGDDHTVALTDKGTVLAWGANRSGQLGTRSTTRQDDPVRVYFSKRDGRIVQVVAAGDTAYARTDTHAVYAWGDGAVGQHGTSTTEIATRPERVTLPDKAKVATLFAGRFHCIATTR